VTTLLGVDLAGRDVLVAGGGPVAALKASAIVRDGALVRVVAPAVCEDLRDLVDSGAVEWSAREVETDDIAEAWLVVAATDDAEANRSLCAAATARRVLSVCAGSAADGTARNPATTDVAGMRVGVVSVGTPDPRRVTRVRDALAAHLASGSVDLRHGRRTPGPGRVALVGGGPGASDLLTLRGRALLSRADVVVTDRLGPVDALANLPSDVEVIDVGKTPGHHQWTQSAINDVLVEQASRGRLVVRLKGGDPYLFGRGGEELAHCRAHGIPVEVVPGISSALSAPAAAGIPLTHRGTVAATHIAHGHGPLADAAIACVVDGSATLVLLMAVTTLADHVEALLAAGADRSTPVAVVEDGTLPTQRVTRAPLAEVVATAERVGVRAPAVVVIGAVAGPELDPGVVAT
jgi:uroporphyrin-III C-methyltransferase/precorrin-2 dehydrogenase/sirohydrochlorin ferrochelatase